MPPSPHHTSILVSNCNAGTIGVHLCAGIANLAIRLKIILQKQKAGTTTFCWAFEIFTLMQTCGYFGDTSITFQWEHADEVVCLSLRTVLPSGPYLLVLESYHTQRLLEQVERMACRKWRLDTFLESDSLVHNLDLSHHHLYQEVVPQELWNTQQAL